MMFFAKFCKNIKIINILFYVMTFFCFVSNAASQEITAIDFEGKILGKVISDGKVVGNDNQIIGNVTADSLILDVNNKIIGGVVPQGIAIGNDVRPLGKVGGDGIVRTSSGQIIGKTIPSGLVINEQYDIVGQVIFPGLVYNDKGKVVGRVTGDGSYGSLDGEQVGIVTPDGYAYRKINKEYVLDGRLISSRMVVSLAGDFIGSVAPGGDVSNFNSENIGHIRANEFVYDNIGGIIGRIVNTSYAFDENGNYIGLVGYNGVVLKDNNPIGKIRADGFVVDKANKVIGVQHPFSSVATDKQGNYLGRLNPQGIIVKASSEVGAVGVKGLVFDKQGNVLGQLISTGPIYDYKGELVGHALHNGKVVTLEGAEIGYMKGTQAYNLSGMIIGATLKDIAIYHNDKFLDIAGISSQISNHNQNFNVSPYGYVISQKGNVEGNILPMTPFYTANGTKYSYLNLNGQSDKIGSKDVERVSGNGFVLTSQNKIAAHNIDARTVVNNEGLNIGISNQDNLLLNKSKQVIGKILPDKSVTTHEISNYMPKLGDAYDSELALSFKGEFLGYVNVTGEVLNNEKGKVGYVVSRNLVSDNNGVIIGFLANYLAARGKECENLGMVSPQGKINNYRGVYIGSILGDGSILSSSGTHLGNLNFQSLVVDYEGNVVGYSNSAGNVISIEGNNLGCLDAKQHLRNAEGELIAGVIYYEPVIGFDGQIIGYTTLDGRVVDGENTVIGYQQPNGNINSTSGVPQGTIMQYKIAFDMNNKFLGYVDSKGKVINNHQKSVGLVDFDGNVKSQGNIIGYAIDNFYVYDNTDTVAGIINRQGEVTDFNNQVIGTFDRGFVVKDGQVIARSKRDYNIRDKQHLVIGYLQLDGNVIDIKSNIIGKIDEQGNIKKSDNVVIAQATPLQYYHVPLLKTSDKEDKLQEETGPKLKAIKDKDGNIIGYIDENNVLFNEKGEIIGKIDEKGQLIDEQGNIIGKINDNGEIVDAQGNIIGSIKSLNNDDLLLNDKILQQLQNNKYKAPQVSSDKAQSKQKDDPQDLFIENDNKYYKSLGIALTIDGDYLGEITSDNEVINDDGEVVGYRMPDGLIIDAEGNLIGTETLYKQNEIAKTEKDNTNKNSGVPLGSFGAGGAYGVGSGNAGNLGPGGGYGPGERYDPIRQMALNTAMQERRKGISVGKISSNIRREAFDLYQKDWSEQGIGKTISSWRVDMSEMLIAGKAIPAVIARAIDTNNAAPVVAYVERNVYAEEGRNIIIPAGSRLLGEFGSISGPQEATSASARVQISWTRLIRPDGSMFAFDGQTADAQGRIGALGYVDQQLLKKYTLPTLTTLLSSSVAYLFSTDEESEGETENSKQQAASDARQNFLDEMETLFDEILADKTGTKAITYVPNGTRIIIYPSQDLWIRSVERDKEKSEDGKGEFKGLIDKDVTHTSANLPPGEQTYGPGGPTSTLGGSGDVVYSADNPQVSKASSMPLIAPNNPPKKQVVIPPPPVYNNATVPPDMIDDQSEAYVEDREGVPALF